jgi:hypothetical protein
MTDERAEQSAYHHEAERQRIDEQFVDRAHHAPETGEQRDEQPMRDNYERYTK